MLILQTEMKIREKILIICIKAAANTYQKAIK